MKLFNKREIYMADGRERKLEIPMWIEIYALLTLDCVIQIAYERGRFKK